MITTPTASPASAAVPAPTSALSRRAAEIFFTAAGKLAPEKAQVEAAAPLGPALALLMEGPKEAAHFSEIPPSAKLQDVAVNGPVATLSFDDSFFAAGGSGVQLRLAQVVYTATQFAPVTSVQFLRQGQAVDVIGEGFPLNRPLTREQFAQLAT